MTDYPKVISMDILIKCKCNYEQVIEGVRTDTLKMGHIHQCPICRRKTILEFSEYGNKVEHHFVELKHVREYYTKEEEVGEVKEGK